MRTPFLRSLSGCFCLLACCWQVSAGLVPLMARDALVGKWTATVTPDDSGKETTDAITFKGGKFESENETKDGFEAATYEDSPAPMGMSAKFTVTLKNKAGDTAVWSGFSTGAELSGTLVITKKDGVPVSYSFKATKTKG